MGLPTPHVVTARDYARLDAFGYPGLDDEITNLSFHPHQVAGPHAQPGRITCVQPQRIRVRDFIQPLRVRAAGVNLDRQTERGDQNRLIRCEIIRMNVTLDVSWKRILWPAPFGERL